MNNLKKEKLKAKKHNQGINNRHLLFLKTEDELQKKYFREKRSKQDDKKADKKDKDNKKKSIV